MTATASIAPTATTTPAAPPPLSAHDVHWDLSRLYAGPVDEKIAVDQAEIERRIVALERHRGTIETGDAGHIAAVVEELEVVSALWNRLCGYTHLLACVDEQDERKVALRERYDGLSRRWQARLVFIDLELQRIPAERERTIIDDAALTPYRHYVRHQRTLAAFTLSEKEEQVILRKNVAGRDAIVRFREEFAAKMDFGRMSVEGVEREMTESELHALMRHSDPLVREAAALRKYETYAKNRAVIHFLYSCVVNDQGTEREMRGYKEPIDVENTSNEIDRAVVDQAIAACRRNLSVVHDFYLFKAKVLGIPRLKTSDRLAPITGERPRPIVWSEGRRLISQSLARFDGEFHRAAEVFYEERRVDASVHKGKRGGGFCAPVPSEDPYILVNYTDDADSMLTMAHELGHAVHFAFSRRSQRLLQAYGMSKVIAETASEFFEAVLSDHLIETVGDPVLERYLLGHEIDGFLSTVNRQLMFTEFELAAHGLAAKGPISAEALSELWEKLSKEFYGPHVDLLPGERVGWATIPHFFFNPFYCVSYALSHVVVLALYARWRETGASFVPGYKALLAAGWSGSPTELLAKAGIDLADPKIYDAAYRELARRIERLKKLIPVQAG
jgi:oligoendopeptidase F